nr:tol-Pal system protein TolA-like [Aegilops tauschii subsp. strangulata]
MEEEGASRDNSGSVPATNVGGEGTTSSQLGIDPPSTDQEDIVTVIEEVAKDAEAEATKITNGEATKSAAEEVARGPAGETGEAAAGEAGKGPAEESGKAATNEAGKAAAEEAAKEIAREGRPTTDLPPPQPQHRARTADTRAPADGEVFDDEALATTGLQVVDEPSASSGGSQEEQLLLAMSANF